MKAWTYSRAGLPTKTLKLVEVPVPSLPTPTSVLVKVSHVSLHPGTSIMAQIIPFLFRKSPAVAETDFSGTIVAVGEKAEGARRLSVGSSVFGTIAVPSHLSTGAGALGEYVAVESATVALTPDGVLPEAACGFGVSAPTALALVDAALLKPGARVIVNSPCGGVGHFATQLARRAVGPEGRVVGICSEANESFARELGCDEVVAYDRVPGGISVPQYLGQRYGLSSEFGGFDAVIDAYGSQPLWLDSPKYLKPGNECPYATVGTKAPVKVSFSAMAWSLWGMISNSLWPVWLGGIPRRYSMISMFVDEKTMERVRKEAEAGAFNVHVGGRWKFEDAKQVRYGQYDSRLDCRNPSTNQSMIPRRTWSCSMGMHEGN